MKVISALLSIDLHFPEGTTDIAKNAIRTECYQTLLGNGFVKRKTSSTFALILPNPPQEVDTGKVKERLLQKLSEIKKALSAKHKLAFNLVADLMVSYTPPEEIVL